MYASDYFETKICNLLRGESINAPTAVYLALYISNPNDNNTGQEITYSEYARQSVTFSEPSSNGSGYLISNSQQINFPECGTNAGTVTHLGVLDNANGGNLLLYGELDTPLVITSGTTPVIRTNSIKWILTGDISVYYKKAILNVFRNTNVVGFSPYIALYSGDPSGSGTEFSENNYSRFSVDFNQPQSASGSQATVITNSDDILSPVSTGYWGQLNYIAICDSDEGGNIFASIALDQTINMTYGKSAGFHAGDLKFNVN